MINITEEKFKELLSKAYDAGWYGIRELNAHVVEEMFVKFMEEDSASRAAPVQADPFTRSTTTFTTGTFTINVGGGGVGGAAPAGAVSEAPRTSMGIGGIGDTRVTSIGGIGDIRAATRINEAREIRSSIMAARELERDLVRSIESAIDGGFIGGIDGRGRGLGTRGPDGILASPTNIEVWGGGGAGSDSGSGDPSPQISIPIPVMPSITITYDTRIPQPEVSSPPEPVPAPVQMDPLEELERLRAEDRHATDPFFNAGFFGG